MTLFAELNGSRIIDGRVIVPSFGPWHADVTLDKETTLPTSILTLSLGDLSLKCSPWRAPAPYQGKTRVRLIAGRAGWRRELEPKPYRLDVGVKLSLVLGDAAKTVGETIVIGTDRVVGKFYIRDRQPAHRLLNRLVPRAWWIDFAGVTHTGERATSAIGSTFTLASFDGAKGVAVVASEHLADFVPGRTMKGITLATTLTIAGVTHSITKSGVRTEVMAA